MFFVARHVKLVIFFTSAMCLSLVNTPIPVLHSSTELLAFFFLLSEIKHYSYHKRMLKQTILWHIMILMLIAMLVLFVYSPHYLSVHGFIVLFKTEILVKYFVVVYAFMALEKEKDLKYVYRYSLVALSVLTLFAIDNLILGRCDFVSDMMKDRGFFTAMDNAGQDMGERYSYYDDRFRVQAMFLLAFDYGYVCAVMFLFYWYGLLKKIIPRGQGLYALFCCLFGIFTCNCRTVLFCLLISLMFFYYSVYGKRIIKYMFMLLFSFVLIYMSSSNFSKNVNERIISIVVQNDNVGGSSLVMRAVQYATVLSYVQGHELFGRGKDFFLIDMGWQDGRDFLVDPDLQGIEGVLLNLILERGFVGVLFWFSFYAGLFFYFRKNRKYCDKTASIGMTLVVYYFIYANMTGEMGCVYPTMLLLGIIVKEVYFAKKSQVVICNNIIEKK